MAPTVGLKLFYGVTSNRKVVDQFLDAKAWNDGNPSKGRGMLTIGSSYTYTIFQPQLQLHDILTTLSLTDLTTNRMDLKDDDKCQTDLTTKGDNMLTTSLTETQIYTLTTKCVGEAPNHLKWTMELMTIDTCLPACLTKYEDSTLVRPLPGKCLDGPRLGVSTRGLEDDSPPAILAIHGGSGALMLNCGEIPYSV